MNSSAQNQPRPSSPREAHPRTRIPRASSGATSSGCRPDPADPAALPPLTWRERQVLAELAEGKTNAEIGASLHLSPGTVKGYLSAIMAKWEARDRMQVLILAVRSALVRLD